MTVLVTGATGFVGRHVVEAGRLVDAALGLRAALRGQVFDVNDGRPISLRVIVETLVRELGLRRPRVSVPYSLARVLLRFASGAVRWTAAHRLHRFHRSAAWYRQELS